MQFTLDRRSSILDAEEEALTDEPCADPCPTPRGGQTFPLRVERDQFGLLIRWPENLGNVQGLCSLPTKRNKG